MISLGDVGAGAKLGPYELLVPIARGATAMIWAARVSDIPGLETLVAIKALLPAPKNDPERDERFRTAAELASQVRNPHVAEILDVGDHEGVLYVAMEWVEGEAVTTILKAAGKGLPVGIATKIAIDTAVGLHAAHELRRDGSVVGLVHGDVSPGNILVSFEGAVKIVGFGIAEKQRSTGSNAPTFMAPEQMEGKAVDRRADVFSLGVCLYQMVTGKHPFERAGVDPKAPIQLVPTCPPALDAAILKAIAKDRDKRFATMLELSEALSAALAASKPADRAGEAEVGAYAKGLLGDRASKREAAVAQAIRATDERGSSVSARPPSPLAAAVIAAPVTRESPVAAKAKEPVVTKEPVRAAPAAPPAAAGPSRVLADLGEVLRESDEPLAIGIRLRITLDVLESIEDAPLRKRTATSRMHVGRVRIDADGISSVEGAGDATGAALLAWEILAGRASKEDPPPSVGEVAEDVPSAVDEALREALESNAIATTSALHARLDDASRGFADATGDVREAIAKWLREVSDAPPEKPSAPAKPDPKKSAQAPTPAPQAKPEPKPPAAAPVIEAPVVKAPVIEAPVVKAPVVKAPVVKAPVIETPVVKAPVIEAPVVKAPVIEAPVAKAPVIEAPVVKAPVIEAPVVKAPVIEASVVKAPVVKAPVIEAPVVKAPVIEASVVKAPVVKAPVIEAPVVKAPIIEAPAAKPEPVRVSPAPPPVEPALTEAPKPAVSSPKIVAKAQRTAKRPPPPKVKQYDSPLDDAPSPDPAADVAASAPSSQEKVAPAAATSDAAPVSLPVESIADWSDDADDEPTLLRELEDAPPAAVAKKAPPVPIKKAEPAAPPVSTKARVSVRPAAAATQPAVSASAAQAPAAARRSVRPSPPVQATASAYASTDNEEDVVVAAQRIASRRRWVLLGITLGALALTAVLGVVISSSSDPTSGADAGASSSDPIPPLRERMRGPRAVEQPVETAAVPSVPSPAPIPSAIPASSASASPSSRGPSGPSAPVRPKDSAKPFLPNHI